MPDSYQTQGEPEAKETTAAVRKGRRSIFSDPVVRWLTVVAVGLVIMYMVTVISALMMGVLNPTEPRTRAERDIQYFEMLTVQDPKNTETWKGYINALMSTKQYLKAQAVIDRAKKGVDQSATQDISAAQAELFLATKKYREAIKTSDDVRKALTAFYEKSRKIPGTAEAKGEQINNNFYSMLIVKASAQEELGDIKGAVKTLDAYIKDKPTAADVLVKRGLLRAATGDKKGAEADYRAALEYIPNDQAALDGLEQIGVKP